MGVNITHRISSSVTQSVCVDVKDCQFKIGPGLVKARGKDKYKIPVYARILSQSHPVRFQSPPLVMDKFKQIEKKGYGFAIMNFDYRSNQKPIAATKWQVQMSIFDSKVLAWLYQNRKTVWPDEELTMEQVEGRYNGLSKEKKWVKKQPEKKEAENGEKTVALKKGEDGQYWIYSDARGPGADPDDSAQQPPDKKAKIDDSDKMEHEVTGDRLNSEEESKEVIYPAQYTIFPALQGKNFTAQCTGVDGKLVKISSLKEGMEIVSVSDCGLEARKGIVYASLTGHKFAVKQLDVAGHCQIASEMLVP